MVNWLLVRDDATSVSGQAETRLEVFERARGAAHDPFFTIRGRRRYVRLFIAEPRMPLESYAVSDLYELVEAERREVEGLGRARVNVCCGAHAGGAPKSEPCHDGTPL